MHTTDFVVWVGGGYTRTPYPLATLPPRYPTPPYPIIYHPRCSTSRIPYHQILPIFVVSEGRVLGYGIPTPIPYPQIHYPPDTLSPGYLTSQIPYSHTLHPDTLPSQIPYPPRYPTLPDTLPLDTLPPITYIPDTLPPGKDKGPEIPYP